MYFSSALWLELTEWSYFQMCSLNTVLQQPISGCPWWNTSCNNGWNVLFFGCTVLLEFFVWNIRFYGRLFGLMLSILVHFSSRRRTVKLIQAIALGRWSEWVSCQFQLGYCGCAVNFRVINTLMNDVGLRSISKDFLIQSAPFIYRDIIILQLWLVEKKNTLSNTSTVYLLILKSFVDYAMGLLPDT